jgi:hypothetical protein
MILSPRSFVRLAFALVCLLGCTGVLLAQSTGSIRGTVTDPTGANVSGVTVSATQIDTGFKRTLTTNDSGLYVFTDLPIGPYTVEVARSGFIAQKLTGSTLLTGQTLDINITLAVGATTETVTVDSTVDDVRASTSEVATSVNTEQIEDLPLNGRNVLQLTTLTPGAVLTNTGTESGQQDNIGLTVNGLRATQNNYELDGAIYLNRFFDSVPILPSPDALQEFTIQAANFSAQYPGAGALVQLSTRSGTNQFHGSAFEFFRNTVLNARSYFATVRPPYKLNQFGGTVGGPIRRGKTFFFFSAEDLQQRSSVNPYTVQLPTAAQLTGDFSSLLTLAKPVLIYNPSTGAPYPGNKITTAMDPLSAAVEKAFLAPTPANPTTGLYAGYAPNNIDRTQYVVKIDHQISGTNHLSGRYFYNEDNFQRPFSAPLGFDAANNFRNQSLTLADTQNFSNTLTATVTVTAGRFARTQVPVSPGLAGLQSLGQNVPLGTTNIPIFTGVRANISGFVNIFSGGGLTQDPTSFEYKATVVKLLGAHTLSFGGTFERDRIDATDFSYTPGDNTFNGQRTAAPSGAATPAGYTAGAYTTGYAVADFYLGLESNFFQDNGRKFYLRENRPSLYVQDDWKVTKSLTLNAGVRWDPWLPPVDLNSTLVGFTPGVQSTIAPNAPLGLRFNGDTGLQASVFPKNWKDFAPRIGFAYNVGGNGSTIIRGAYGIFYGFPEALLYQRTDQNQPVDLYLNIPNPAAAWDSPYTGFAGGDPFPRAHVAPSAFSTYQFLLPFAGGVLDPKAHVEYTQDYNLTLEQQLPGKFLMSLAYVGNHAEHITSSRPINPAISVAGVVSTVANENSRRLYNGLGSVVEAQSYEYAIFNSLQLNVTRRFNKGLTVLSNVVFSKTIDNGSDATELAAGPPNPFNVQSSRGPADFDQAVRFNASVNYITPMYHGSAVLRSVLNGWQANMIAELQTGTPFTLLSGTDRSLSGVGNDYADSVPGQNPTARRAGANRYQQYFNTAAYAPAALGTYGNTSRNPLRGPGYEDIDFSLFKDFFVDRRIHGQFRAEGFNMLNHTNAGLPVATVSSGTFGQITSPATGSTPRVFQFGAKLLF